MQDDSATSETTSQNHEWLIKSQTLLTNLRHWISHGLSETAVNEIDDYWRQWRKRTNTCDLE